MKLLNERQKKDIYQEFLKMKKAGYIVHINELSKEEQEIINNSPSKYYIAIAPAFKTCSDSTPARIALDGSFPGCHGKSLNEILPAGKLEVNIRRIFRNLRTRKNLMFTDIRKFYNSLKLDKD